ncbi:alanine--tRNA ligase [bacterium]|nr:alanine--tRNA ligase [bacterium]
MNATEIRQSFLEFFKAKGHEIVPSASVVPNDDPTLMFTNAGMNQFKPYFLGQAAPKHSRVADSQKCIRVSGKHNDLEEVGQDTYHHTLFEMLGNWSFGDYYKREAISWAWELLTERWKLPKERLYATVFGGDEAKGLPADTEAEKLWAEVTDIDPTHIKRFGAKDNFWMMGEVGPCGPCSEIHIDLTPDLSGGPLVNAGSPLAIELWNLVFMEFNATPDGLHKLPACNVDTGAGLERVAAVMECTKNCTDFSGQISNYDTVLFRPLIAELERLSGLKYTPGTSKDEASVAMRVCADHLRMVSFSIADGALPSNEGRGYVIRRILRRAARYGRKLGLTEPFMHAMLPILIEVMGKAYPELIREQEKIVKVIKSEEVSFNRTLDRGIALFEEELKVLQADGKKVFPGETAFKLYDTYGFPCDLTAVMARENGLELDEKGFAEQMEAQKTRAREARKKVAQIAESEKLDLPATEFLGYTQTECRAKVLAIVGQPDSRAVVLDRTVCYGEMGGELGDTGCIACGGEIFEIADTKQQEGVVFHFVKADNLDEALPAGTEVTVSVDTERRAAIQRNHTATHLLHHALRSVIGTDVHQQGSLVAPERMRFDFTCSEPVSKENLLRIERMINAEIIANTGVCWFEIPIDQKPDSVIAFFGDKYGARVRVVNVGSELSENASAPRYDGFSQELCGGCHCKRTGDIGLFKIVSEGAIAAGIRRIEAVTGSYALELTEEKDQILENACALLHATQANLNERLAAALEAQKKAEKELARMKDAVAAEKAAQAAQQVQDVDGTPLLVLKVDNAVPEELRKVSEKLRDTFKGVAVLGGPNKEAVGLLVSVSPDYVKQGYKAGNIVKELAARLDGKGGGRPDMAMAGGKNLAKLDEVLAQAADILRLQK